MESDDVNQDQLHLFVFLRTCESSPPPTDPCVRIVAMYGWFCEALLAAMRANQKRLIELFNSLPMTSYVTSDQHWRLGRIIRSPGLTKDASKISARMLSIFDHFQLTHEGITELLNMVLLNAFLSARQKTLQHVHNHDSCPACYRLYENWKLEYLGGVKHLSAKNLNDEE